MSCTPVPSSKPPKPLSGLQQDEAFVSSAVHAKPSPRDKLDQPSQFANPTVPALPGEASLAPLSGSFVSSKPASGPEGSKTKSSKDIKGTKNADTLVGGVGNQRIIGRQSADTLWGDTPDGKKGGNDIFLFEKSFKENGLDTIKDYHWSEDGSDGLGQDVLDLTAALKAFKSAVKLNPSVNIADYVWVEDTTGGVKLMIDVDGTGVQTSQQWALLEGLTTVDPVRIRAFTASGSGSGSGSSSSSSSGSGADLGDGYYIIGNEDPSPIVVSSIVICKDSETDYAVLNATDTVTIAVTMSEVVYVNTDNGVPRLALNIGGTIVDASYVSGSGSSELLFEYTIADGLNDGNGISINANALSANGAVIANIDGKNARLGHEAVADDSDYAVDTTAPVATLAPNSFSGSVPIPTVRLDALGKEIGVDFEQQVAALGTQGAFVVVWSGEDLEGDYSIFVQRFDSDGSLLGAITQLEPPGKANGTDWYPHVAAVGGSGDFVVTWSGPEADGDFSVYVQKFNADGTLAGSTVVVEPSGVTNKDNSVPSIASLGNDGSFVIAFEGKNASNAQNIYIQRFDGSGNKVGGTTELFSPSFSFSYNYGAEVTEIGNGGFVVTWSGIDGDYNSVFAQAFNAAGAKVGAQAKLQAPAFNDGDDDFPKVIAVGNSGDYIIAFFGKESSGDKSVFLQKYDVNGVPLGGLVALEATGVTGGTDYYPTAAPLDTSGAYVVAFTGIDSEGDFSTFVQRFAANGSPDGGMVKLEAAGNLAGNDQGPMVASLGDGRFVVTWWGIDSEGDFSIFVQRFAADGSLAGETIQFEAIGRTNGRDDTALITPIGSDGAFVISWTGEDSSGSKSVFVQRFNADGTFEQAGSFDAQSNELGNAYLIRDTETVGSEAEILALESNLWNKVAIDAVNTDTAITIAGLLPGIYRVYAVDRAGNLSAASNDSITAGSTLAITAATADQSEGDAGSTDFTFTVTRSGDTSGTSSATWTVSGGSGSQPADAADFDGATFPTGTVDFAAGETSKTITVKVNGDAKIENDETFEVSLSAPSVGTSLDATATAATGTIQNDDKQTTIFVIGEAAGWFGPNQGAYAWFDENDNGLLDTTEVNDANRAYFSDPDGSGISNPLEKNIDFSSQSYIVNFVGTGNNGAGAFQAVDLSGFSADDSIIVNFGKATGPGTFSAEVTISAEVSLWGQFAPRAQRGAFSNSAVNFTGYTLSSSKNNFSYTEKVDASSLAVRYQKYDSYSGFSGAFVKVGMSLKPLALFATFGNISKSSNYTQGIPVIAGLKADAPGQASNLANWTSGTTILASQVSVVWPNVYSTPS